MLIQLKDLDATDEHGQTALHEAVRCAKTDAINSLVLAGADVLICNSSGLNVLCFAVELNQLTSLDALLSHPTKVSPDLCDCKGSTAFHYAASRNRSDCAEKLVSPLLRSFSSEL